MKICLQHSVLSLIIIGLFSCEGEYENAAGLSEHEVHSFLDTIHPSIIIASYMEDNSLNVLMKCRESKNARRICFRKNYPVFVDSLSFVKYDEFTSPKLNVSYLIKDTSVFCVKSVKIIHPSSNWQGQTPWQQPYVDSYSRLDKKQEKFIK